MSRSKKRDLTVEEQIKKYKKTRLVLRIFILILTALLIFLFLYKPNVLLTKFFIKGKGAISLKLGESYKDEGYGANILFFDITDKVKVDDKVNYDKIGEYKISYTLNIKALNIHRTLERKVTIIDNVPPELNVDSEDTIYVDLYGEYYRPNYSANDNIDGDITSSVKIEGNVDVNQEGEYTEKFIATDSSGNVTSKEIKIIVEERYKHCYIQVTKSTQTLDYYERGVLVFSSPVVTGDDYDTPLGEFAVNNKLPTARLVGPNNEWDCYVNWWIAFIGSSHGFHDSSWRTAFGGDVWTYNPTHGCINLPKDKAYELYQLVDIGTPVYIVP